jgi:hypothetical protein
MHRAVSSELKQLFKWQSDAKASGSPLFVFVASMADVMADESPGR